MSAQQNEGEPETLFSFELLVEFIRLDRHCEASVELAVGVRLLDFPTLLIYQPQQGSSSVKRPGGEFAFNRGKCCFFKMNLHSLHIQLSNTPLYAMVLDVTEEVPRLVGSCLISLAKAMDRIRQDVSERGVCGPSSHREKGLVSVCSLTGSKIGSISLSYKLLCLGSSLLPRITERRGPRRTSVSEGEEVQDLVEEGDKSAPPLDREGRRPPGVDLSDSNTNCEAESVKITLNQDERGREDAAAEGVVTEQTPGSPAESKTEEDANVFCPPRLYYVNTEEENRRMQEDYKSMKQDIEAFEDWWLEDDEDSNKGPSFPAAPQKVEAETSRAAPNVLGDALRKMPVLNALLVELSQLNIHNADHSQTLHPSAEMSPGHGNTPRTSGRKSRQDASLHLKQSHSLRNCSTPAADASTKNKEDKGLIESQSCIKSHKKKLVPGTTKTFNLRLKQVSPLKSKPRECVKLLQNETKSRTKLKKTIKSRKRKTFVEQSCSLNENVETVMQSVTAGSPLGGTVTLRGNSQRGRAHGKQDRNAPRISAQPSLSGNDLRCIRIPSAGGDAVFQSRDVKQHRSGSDQSQPELDRAREKIESAGNSSSSGSRSSFSAGNEEADYADDFNSLAPSDAFSPDPASSPEPSRAKTPKTPLHSDVCDSGSESVRSRAAHLPVPIKAPRSPQRAMRGTYVLRPRLHASALSFSSDDVDRGTASLEAADPRKRPTAISPGAESAMTPRGQRGESADSGGPARGLSAESISSFEPADAGELEDELGSLDFRKQYQHISQLVACQLPGYTM